MATLSAWATESEERVEASLGADFLVGAVLDVKDLTAARAFYDRIFRDSGGRWEDGDKRLVFRAGVQRIELVERSRPRTLGWTGAHQAFRVPARRLHAIADDLRAVGHEVSWWREDHPSEREPTAYVSDPSGNLVQLIGSNDGTPLLAHANIVVHDIELGEKFYRGVLGGRLDHYHGWRTEDSIEAKSWAAGDDPCAPWTRVSKYAALYHVTVSRPVPQVFLRLGETMLGLVVAAKHVQEPPPEVLRGSPRVILRTPRAIDAVTKRLPTMDVTTSEALHRPRGIRYRREGSTVYLRDRSGNFVQLECNGSTA